MLLLEDGRQDVAGSLSIGIIVSANIVALFIGIIVTIIIIILIIFISSIVFILFGFFFFTSILIPTERRFDKFFNSSRSSTVLISIGFHSIVTPATIVVFSVPSSSGTSGVST